MDAPGMYDEPDMGLDLPLPMQPGWDPFRPGREQEQRDRELEGHPDYDVMPCGCLEGMHYCE